MENICYNPLYINPVTRVKECKTEEKKMADKKLSKAVVAVPPVDEPAVQLPDTSYLIKEIIVSSGIKKRNVMQ